MTQAPDGLEAPPSALAAPDLRAALAAVEGDAPVAPNRRIAARNCPVLPLQTSPPSTLAASGGNANLMAIV